MRAALRWCPAVLATVALASGCRKPNYEPVTEPVPATEAVGTMASPDGRACADVLGHPKADCDYPVYPGYRLALAEEFDTPFDLDHDPLWTWSDGYSDLGFCRYIKEAVVIRNGVATITMDRPPVPFPPEGYPSYAEGLRDHYPADVRPCLLTSGEIRTKYNMFRYGRYEFRLKRPRLGHGTFLATGFVFRSPKWQDWREVDIEITENSDRFLQTNILYGDNRPKYDPSFAGYEEARLPFPIDDGFHVYVIEWLPTRVAFYVDPDRNPRPTRTARPASLPIPDKPGKLMMNLWTYNKPEKGTYPMQYEIDYVRFFKSDLEAGPYPCADAPECLDPADRDYSKNNANDGIPPTKSGYPTQNRNKVALGSGVDGGGVP
jgi:Glycosyl hydrolases family 16